MSEPGGAIRTFLIADIRGYTSFTEKRGDEAGSQLAATFAEISRESQARGVAGSEIVQQEETGAD